MGTSSGTRPRLARTSVIIPTLNEEKLLPRMLSQFTPELIERFNLEIVVSDGGSEDATLEVARRKAHVIVENTAALKQTISIGRNEGAKAATGDVLVFLNADTMIKEVELFFSTMLEEIQGPEIIALTCTVSVYPEEERTMDRAFHGFYNWFFSLMNKVGMAMGRGECHVMKREVFQRVRGY
ncbi:MAG: glycosyltransferase, partial [Bacteroidetes bacterium]|nr:glycosyltransferase [Bacteroidota bacterium]